MKSILLTTVTLAILFSMFACQGTAEKEIEPKKESATSITMANLAAKKLKPGEADDWIQLWKDDSHKYMANHTIEYFDMPMDDLRAVTSQKGVVEARFYMGLEDKRATGGLLTPHLILVGLTEKNGLNVANLDQAYDYTHVCPPLCDLVPPQNK